MCGIVGYVGDRDCADVLVDALSKLEYRGYDSAGIAVFEKGTIKVEKCKGRLANLVDKMAVVPLEPTLFQYIICCWFKLFSG
jgi:glucosamine--fructose-6-phosphate aminotransferase (isomerizing)